MLWEQGRPAEPIARGLAAALESWRGTPYAAGQRRRGVASTCFGFVCGVLDELFGRALPEDMVPRDAEMRTRRKALAAMLRLRRFYMPNVAVQGLVVWPGDLVVMGAAGRASHAAIVGTRPAELWETTRSSKVGPTGFAALLNRGEGVVRVYRMVQA